MSTKWQRIPVKRSCSVFLGKMIQSLQKSPSDTEAPYLRAAHVQPSGLLVEVDDKKMWFGERELPEHDLRAGDVVVVEGGAGFGRSAVIQEDRIGWGFQNSIIRVRPSPDRACGRFVDFALQSALTQGEVEAQCSAATIPHFTADKVASFLIPTPPLDEQLAVADFLDRETSRIDTLIAEQQRLSDLLRERRAAVADQLLCPAVARQPLKRFVEDVTVGIVVNPSAWYDEDGIPALRGLNVRPGYITTSELVYLTPEGDAQHAKSRLRAEDVVVVRTGQAGAAAVVPPELDGANAIDLLIVRPGSGVDPDFLAAYLNTPSTRSSVAEGSVGAIQGHFNVGALRELPFPELTPSEQRSRGVEWRVQAEAIDTLIAETERFIELSRERRSALITAAVTGQIDVREAAA